MGVLGDAYARGLNTGSSGRLAVTAKHFPGQGSLDDASFTIDRSLDDLKKIDLPPFERLMANPIDQGASPGRCAADDECPLSRLRRQHPRTHGAAQPG